MLMMMMSCRSCSLNHICNAHFGASVEISAKLRSLVSSRSCGAKKLLLQRKRELVCDDARNLLLLQRKRELVCDDARNLLLLQRRELVCDDERKPLLLQRKREFFFVSHKGNEWHPIAPTGETSVTDITWVQNSLWVAFRIAVSIILGLGLLVADGISAESAIAAAPILSVKRFFPWEPVQEEIVPDKGTCATCIGVVDDTLGSCNATRNCVSSFDDRAMFFVAPWEFPGKLEVAMEKLNSVLTQSGASITEQSERYIHAVFTTENGERDDVEFLFSAPSVDATVNIRAASRTINYQDGGRNRNRLEQLRMSLTWQQVPILRNRQRRLFFIESPWDTFGPEPPPTFDYKDRLEFFPE
ncbi:unnamed protein product [Sphagnum troendelagicum]|uniref:Uncharacterized protein n=1 Tax=Sphagnum troendelagicum TaxID=128251 RepID=A0ABP0TEA2_9BRYO